MKQNLIILICIFLFSCVEKSQIPIPNTLEIALGNKYSDYVSNLNKAYKKDSSALLKLFKIDYINDAAGYEHGFILYQIMNTYDDKIFSTVLQRLSARELNTVKLYFEVGIDANDKYKYEMKEHYPLSSNTLQIK